ncbi:hypothetical protein L596_019023 [Steinernema carpocapsae]|uniref:Uncharacterized protein n=1 Tax=Steinernema carpocapsae TaxID=34508 RepID=A0A4U5N6X6_STECR|nr:hypothetical protein L596_019023 [Steinernema carpocapsae]
MTAGMMNAGKAPRSLVVPKVIVVDCAGNSLEALGIKDSWLPPNTRLQEKSQPYVERLLPKELEMSLRLPRSRSVELGYFGASGEKYLSRWSRENTPVDSSARFERNVRRSYTPVREIGAYKVVDDERRPYSSYRARTPIGMVTSPYHTNINYYSETQPLRKYDVFQLRTWSYPIYKYIYGRDTHSSRPYSYTSSACYGTTPKYTPPTMRADCHPMTTRRSYSGYSYMAGEHSFDIASRPYSLSSSYTKFWRSHVSSAPYYSYSGSSSLRHYNSYRPTPMYSSRISLYWKPYY